jgi:hypothetical protein
MDTQLSIQAAATCVSMKVKGLIGINAPHINLESSDRMYRLSIPQELIPTLRPDEMAVVTISVVRVTTAVN